MYKNCRMCSRWLSRTQYGKFPDPFTDFEMTIGPADLPNLRLAIIGLGYVGLPLAVEFGKKRPVVGFDVNVRRIDELNRGVDNTLETTQSELAEARLLRFTTDLHKLRECNCYIVTVPTPIDEHKRPNLLPLINASETVGQVLKKGDLVIYESTVYPGCTEDDCVPVLERMSGLVYNRDFFCGYSPERINPGDKVHRVIAIKKVTSGSNPEVAGLVDALYNEIIVAGTYKAASIRVAEAAKVIENTQRDLNIALINELALIFNRIGIDTEAVLEAAGTKWNFLPFRPGLVGGHCIGVDPYYLTHKAQSIGYHPEVILAGRRLNDSMGRYVAAQLVKAMMKRRIQVDGAKVLVMGLAFKENCPDIRNTRIVDIISELRDFNCSVDVYDPWVSSAEAQREYGFSLCEMVHPNTYDAVILAVAHREFYEMGSDVIRALGKSSSVLYDLKYVLSQAESDLRL